MKRLLVLVLLCAAATPCPAAEQMLFSGHGQMQGFGAPVVNYTQIRGKSVVLLGGRGGWIMDHKLVVAGGAYFLVTDVNDPTIPDTIRDTEYGYGGLEIEYVFRSDSLVHVTLYGLWGGGSLKVRRSDSRHGNSDLFGIFDPMAAVELNVTRYFRLNVGVGYRLMKGVDTPTVTTGDFDGVHGTLTLKLGMF
jgi:hypothetical protein